MRERGAGGFFLYLNLGMLVCEGGRKERKRTGWKEKRGMKENRKKTIFFFFWFYLLSASRKKHCLRGTLSG